jgi:hypothetical protein
VHDKDLDEIYGAVIDSLAARKLRLTNPQAAQQAQELPQWEK